MEAAMMSDVLLRQIAKGEGVHSEFRRGLDNLESLAEVVCSFLNTQGGTIFCGIGEDGQVTGLSPAEQDPQRGHGLHRALA
ncbi:MAG: ATP-binding protein, partial [Dokdonella sp.]